MLWNIIRQPIWLLCQIVTGYCILILFQHTQTSVILLYRLAPNTLFCFLYNLIKKQKLKLLFISFFISILFLRQAIHWNQPRTIKELTWLPFQKVLYFHSNFTLFLILVFKQFIEAELLVIKKLPQDVKRRGSNFFFFGAFYCYLLWFSGLLACLPSCLKLLAACPPDVGGRQ